MSSFRKKRWYPAAGGTPVTIGDDQAGEFITEPTPPAHIRSVEEWAAYQAANRQRADHLNAADELQWTVNRVHASADEAFKFSRLHHAEVATLGVLEDGGDGYTTLYLLAAQIETVCLEWAGLTTIFQYRVRGGPWALRSKLATST